MPPKGFFKNVQAQLVTVPACAECNNGASAVDEDLRFYISAQIGKPTTTAAALWDAGAHRTIRYKTTLRNKFLATLHRMPVPGYPNSTKSRLAFEVPVALYQAVFERTTRGLYFHHTAAILGTEVPVLVTVLNENVDIDAPDLASLRRMAIGGTALVYRYGVDEKNACNSLWLYEFHKSHHILVKTGALAKDDV